MSRNTWFVLAAAVAAGCAASSPQGSTGGDQNQGPTGSGGDAGATGPTGSPADDAGQGGDTGTVTGPFDAGLTSTATPLPFYLSDQFAPSGFMGDSMASMSAITLSHEVATCKAPRQAGAGGDCYTATWAPTLTGDAGSAWAGVYWQSPANNWGAKPGKAIAPGATKVTFYAAGAAGGESIQLCAGGINANAASATLPYSDTFSVKQPAITLTTSWQQFELSLAGTSYTDVLGGFCWVATSTTSESITFYLDDVQWQ